jgi:hypothetical protein
VALVRLWVGAQMRRHWRAQVGLALLLGVVGAVVLTTGAGARATASAYNRFLSRQVIPDAELDGLSDEAAAAAAHLPGVDASARYSVLFAAPARPGVGAGRDFIVFAGVDRAFGRTVDRPIVLHGRLPRPGAADEVVVNEDAATKFKLRVGSRTKTTSLGADESDALFAGRYDQLKFHGPTPAVRVVGVVRTRLDLGHAGYAKDYFITTPAFYRAYGGLMFHYQPELDVRLRHPAGVGAFMAAARATVRRVAPDAADQFNGRDIQAGLKSIRDATRVQALALGLVAAAAALAGLFALVQMIARSVATMSDDFPSLRAMGVAGGGRARLVAASLGPAALAGAVLAFVAAVLASALFPTGVARRAGPPPGDHVDALVLVPGAVVLCLVAIGGAAIAAYRWRPQPLMADGSSSVGPLDRLAGMLPPAPRIGVRWALPRRGMVVTGRGRAAITGAVVGMCALVGAITYWAGLDHLVTTPSAYGWTFDVDGGGGNDVAQVEQMRDALLKSSVVGDVALARIVGSAYIGRTQGDLYGFQPVRGHIGAEVLRGRAPVADDEVVLGTKTARQLHKGVGSTVHIAGEPGAKGPDLRVVGVGLLPTIEGDTFALGAAFTRHGLEQLVQGNGYLEAVFRLRPGVDRGRALAQLRRSSLLKDVAAPPGDVRNLDLVRDYPLWVAGFLAALGLLAVGHALLVTARRRSQQVGILRALGLTRPQIVGAVSTQGGSTCIAGAVVGLPLGIALGRWTWAASAHQLGVAEGVTAPLGILLAVIAVGSVLLAGFGAAAGWWAGRSTPAHALRAP